MVGIPDRVWLRAALSERLGIQSPSNREFGNPSLIGSPLRFTAAISDWRTSTGVVQPFHIQFLS
jgi:hypothetical protein